MAGIIFYVALHHFIIYSRRPDYRISLTFACTCVAMGCYDIFATALYNAPSPKEGLVWLRAQLATLAVVGLFFTWFLADYSERVGKRWLYGFTGFFGASALLQIIDRSNLTWQVDKVFVKHVSLPFHIHVKYQEVMPGIGTTILGAGGILLFVYTVGICVKVYQDGDRHKSIPLIAAMTILSLGLMNDLAVLAGVYEFIYLIEYAYLAVVVLMADMLARDLVEATKVKKALQVSEDFFRMLAENTSDWIWEIDETCCYRYASPKSKELLGYEPYEVLGKTPFDFMPEEEAERFELQFEQIFASRHPFAVLERRTVHKDGRLVILESSGVPIIDAKGGFHGFRGVDRDVTMRKEAEEKIKRINIELEQRVKERTQELERAYEELKLLDQAKDAFLSSVSHELRTPLTSIRSFSEILLNYEDIDPASQKEFITIINMESERLTRLINDVLDIAKIEAGKGTWNDDLVDLEKTIQRVADVQRPLLAKKALTLCLDLPEDLPPVYADPDRIQQVFTNLVDNAAKFSPNGGRITIKAELVDAHQSDESEAAWIKVGVSDQGIGISEKDFKTIFDKFGQVAHDSTYEKPKGTGLGLPICRQIVTHYGGEIWVESTKGRGSTFWFTLPIAHRTTEPATRMPLERASCEAFL